MWSNTSSGKHLKLAAAVVLHKDSKDDFRLKSQHKELYPSSSITDPTRSICSYCLPVCSADLLKMYS